MKWLTSDYSDFYIEEEQIYNPCGELIETVYYIRYADYNIFGKKKYTRFYKVVYCAYDNFVQVLHWNSKEEALNFWKEQKSITKSIKHKIKCNE